MSLTQQQLSQRSILQISLAETSECCGKLKWDERGTATARVCDDCPLLIAARRLDIRDAARAE